MSTSSCAHPRRGGERSRAGQRVPCAGESECTHLASRSQARAADSGQRGAGGDRGGHGRRSAAGGRRGRGGVSDFLFVAQGRSGGSGHGGSPQVVASVVIETDVLPWGQGTGECRSKLGSFAEPTHRSRRLQFLSECLRQYFSDKI